MVELVEPVEPRKRGHGPLRGASFYTRRGLGLREFSKQTPSNEGQDDRGIIMLAPRTMTLGQGGKL